MPVRLYALILGDCLAPSPRIIIRYRNTRQPPTLHSPSKAKQKHTALTPRYFVRTRDCSHYPGRNSNTPAILRARLILRWYDILKSGHLECHRVRLAFDSKGSLLSMSQNFSLNFTLFPNVPSSNFIFSILCFHKFSLLNIHC